MTVSHLVFLVEEPSMETFLRSLLPRLLPTDCSFEVHAFQGKSDLLGKLAARLRGYAQWLPATWRIFVVIDRDDDDCGELKIRLETLTQQAGLSTRCQTGSSIWQVVTRIAIEELEAWYFGDWDAVMAAYPRVPSTIPQRQGFRIPDAVAGGTWEAFERILQRHGYFKTGLLKIDAARTIAPYIAPERNRSVSFQAFHRALTEALRSG